MIRQVHAVRSRRGFRPGFQRLEGRLLLTGGRLDTSFGGAGTGSYVAQLPSEPGLTDASLVGVESDGSVLIGGPATTASGTNTFGVVHLTANGTLDTSFGDDGEADVVLPSGFNLSEDPFSLLVQPDNKVLLLSEAFTDQSGVETNYDVIARFDADGQSDPTFGTNGVLVLNTYALSPYFYAATLAALQPNGQIVLVPRPR
jgi:uncharacterized delta-60 repeat protein